MVYLRTTVLYTKTNNINNKTISRINTDNMYTRTEHIKNKRSKLDYSPLSVD